MIGAVIEVPALTAAIWALAALGIGNPAVPLVQVFRLSALFAGVAALLTAGGIGRLAADAAVDGGRRRAMWVAARAHAAASAGLLVIATIPHGELPATPVGWLPIPAAGLVVGAACGAIIGALCGGAAPVELADVWSLARRPSEALRSWLDPSELVRLGSAVRHRTTDLLEDMFEGMFQPAPPPPAAPTAGAPPAQTPSPAPTPPPPPTTPGAPTAATDHGATPAPTPAPTDDAPRP